MAELKEYEVAMSWLVMASSVVPQMPSFNQFSYFVCCTIKKSTGLSEIKLPDTYLPTVPVTAVKFHAQYSQCKFVPVVDGTVKGPLKMTCSGDTDAETVVAVLVTACSGWAAASADESGV